MQDELEKKRLLLDVQLNETYHVNKKHNTREWVATQEDAEFDAERINRTVHVTYTFWHLKFRLVIQQKGVVISVPVHHN